MLEATALPTEPQPLAINAKCFLNGPNQASFCLFPFFSLDKYSTNLTINYKSVDGVLGTQTHGGSMVDADKSTELWRHPINVKCYH